MKEIDFSNFEPNNKSGSGGNGISFLRFERDRDYRIRPIGGAVEFHKLFIEKGKPSLIVDSKIKDQAAKLLSEKTGKEIKPSYRCAMFIIDREDKKVKILEGGFSIFDAFGNWSKAMDVKPGSGAGVDWQIKVTGDGVGGSNPRRYAPTALNPVPFSEEETAMLKAMKAEGKLTLGAYLKETPLDKVLSEVFGEEPAVQTAASSDPMDF